MKPFMAMVNGVAELGLGGDLIRASTGTGLGSHP